ncbi:DUF2334 domain-containing protein [Clostridium paridis]|uniref:DUF2334 domain-containing protein n=1 Tax=Clostridium paridis TaxID=2803863 RepID=A0A937FHQ8_9CLOT|nr:DUF2334 domain-containing protein [Clostridium paridis]MBL4934130.1 DUF2334 domain-containing protein [Clostridium paridis]
MIRKIFCITSNILILFILITLLNPIVVTKFSKSSINSKTIDSLYKINNINIFYGNKKLFFKHSLYQKSQRYYIPISEFCTKMGAKLIESQEYFKIINKKDSLLISKISNSIKYNNLSKPLRGDILSIGELSYLSISDIEEVFSLITYWDFENSKIIFSPIERVSTSDNKTGENIALIRLEDVVCGEVYLDSTNLYKLKVLGNYMQKSNLKFSVAWIPRYKDPSEDIDNDLLTNINMENSAFINTLDYLIYRDGVIGLHGYTHQHGNERSVTSNELTRDYNTTEEEVTNILKSSIKTANLLNIPYNFFETPHYEATANQQKIIEKYFDYIYEPYVGKWNKTPILSERNHHTFYIPTPLSYIKDYDVAPLIRELNKKNTNILNSFFYHPCKEFDFIDIYSNYQGFILFYYSTKSPLSIISKTLEENNFVTIKITDIK